MKKYRLEVSQNGWEYTGYTFITANELKRVDRETVIADGVTVQFDEQIGMITEVEEL